MLGWETTSRSHLEANGEGIICVVYSVLSQKTEFQVCSNLDGCVVA